MVPKIFNKNLVRHLTGQKKLNVFVVNLLHDNTKITLLQSMTLHNIQEFSNDPSSSFQSSSVKVLIFAGEANEEEEGRVEMSLENNNYRIILLFNFHLRMDMLLMNGHTHFMFSGQYNSMSFIVRRHLSNTPIQQGGRVVTIVVIQDEV